MAENFMAILKTCDKCGKTYMPAHQSAECPGHERLVDKMADDIHLKGNEPDENLKLKYEVTGILDELVKSVQKTKLTTLSLGTTAVAEDIIKVVRAKTASILEKDHQLGLEIAGQQGYEAGLDTGRAEKDKEIRDFIKKWESPQYSTPGFVHLVIPVKVANKFEVEGMMARKKIGKFIPNAVTSSNRKNQSL